MAKARKVFVCQSCGAESAKWIGKCPSCNNWNTYVEEIISPPTKQVGIPIDKGNSAKPTLLQDIDSLNYKRIKTGISEFDRILGGGIVPGSLILIGGDPGIGKSTLALQIAMQIKSKVLYVSGEESLQQIKIRSNRLEGNNQNCIVYNDIQIEQILNQVQQISPELIVIDSIQTIFSSTIESGPGSVSQVRECAASLLRFANQSSIPIIIIGHITKDGALAGPKVLEHIVDTVLQFEGDQHLQYRMLRSIKNRFGSVPELGVFEMNDKGLIEVIDTSGLFLSSSRTEQSGLAITCTIDGVKPFLVEVQALVGTASYGTPQRSSTGMDVRKLNMLLAVLEKRGGINLSNKDVFLNIAGGLKIQDTAIDAAVIMAIVSSQYDRSIPASLCLCAEISLTGELKPVNRMEQRIREAEKMGFTDMVIADFYRDNKIKAGLKLHFASTIKDVFKAIPKSNNQSEN